MTLVDFISKFCRDYTNPYLPVNPTAIEGPVQVSLFWLPFELHYWIFTDKLFSPAYCWRWWKEERTWEQCASCINWEYAVCRHHRCSSHCEEDLCDYMFPFHGILFLMSFTHTLLCLFIIGILCIWYCPEDCYIREKWWNTGANSVPRYAFCHD